MATAAKAQTESTAAAKPAEQEEALAPIVVDFGKKRRKHVKRLRKGRGRLMTKVEDLLQDLRDEGVVAENAQPVIIVVRQREGDSKWW